MASDKLGMFPAQKIHNGLNPQHQHVFPGDFGRGPQLSHHISAVSSGDPGPKTATRELTAGFLDHQHFFQPQPPNQPAELRHQWNSSGGDISSDDDDDDADDEDEEEEEQQNLGDLVTLAKTSDGKQNDRNSSSSNCSKMKYVSTLGVKEVNLGQSGNDSNNENNSSCEMRSARDGETYHSQFVDGGEGPSSSSRQKVIAVVENVCGFSGRKEGSCFIDSGESLRAILSDPLTGLLMDDAMILPCGHSFSGRGMQQIVRQKACCTCSQPVSEDSILPNLSLRHAVQAFRREEDSLVNKTSKRRRERYERDNGTYGDSILTEQLRARGVQFPFAVSDRVIIKGNKRTPGRFVGREAIVTTQCLNGWYVVKTLDNAESVKLQYRSLAKVADNPSQPSPVKVVPSWL